ncbi:MAG: bifunctional 4-hydroxy-2-oxoglutarate aldolase/2-dehydro-3-deoxy-phosphogluconate aldolase [Xanthomonadales bacterium]|nr:bifunctional 4-hydroxy-2-oxoglutarate aldolase/2-dehydro-3-deoxy-phosphogluconate aldolase [Xanthomonadales bacterium]
MRRDPRTTYFDELLGQAPVLPVLSIAHVEQAVPLAQTLVDAGLPVLEITLRSPVAMEAIRRIREQVPKAMVGVGTVLTPRQLAEVAQLGVAFAISPGTTPTLYAAAGDTPVPFIPAIATASELMTGLEQGYRRFKFFPAVPMGGVGTLKAFGGPFPEAKFCPTGGIHAQNAIEFLSLHNVITVGGSWMVPGTALATGDYDSIGTLASAAARLKR